MKNAHIAFNGPPVDFSNENAFIVVTLDERCRRQQLREGWFEALGDVPRQAVSMTVREMMKSEAVISAVPHASKAQAIRAGLCPRQQLFKALA